MNKKFISIDLDGTLLTSCKKISSKDKSIIKRAQELGHIIMIATGRSYEDSLNYAKELEIDKYSGLLATYNGSVITDIKNNIEIDNIKFDISLLKEIIAFIDSLKVDYSLMKDGTLYTNYNTKLPIRLYRRLTVKDIVKNQNFSETIDFSANKLLLNDTRKQLEKTKILLEEKFSGKINVCFSSPVSIEIMPVKASKGIASINMAKRFGIDKKDTIAFGNTGNDESMILMCEIGVVVANASNKLKEMADYVTSSNNRSGVGTYIEKYILGE